MTDRDYSYRSPEHQAAHHKNIHPGGDVTPMHDCPEPSCRQATSDDWPVAGRDRFTEHDESWCGDAKSADSLIVCTLSPGHDGDHIGADAWGKTIATWPRAETQPDLRQNISGRSQPRPSGEPVEHDIVWEGLADGSVRAICDCGEHYTLAPRHRTEGLVRFDVMHCEGTS